MRELYHNVTNNRNNLYGLYLRKKRKELKVTCTQLVIKMQERGLTEARREFIYQIERGIRTVNDIEIFTINRILGLNSAEVEEFIVSEIRRNSERLPENETEEV